MMMLIKKLLTIIILIIMLGVFFVDVVPSEKFGYFLSVLTLILVLLNTDKIKELSLFGLKLKLKENIEKAKKATQKAEEATQKTILAIKELLENRYKDYVNNLFINHYTNGLSIAIYTASEEDKRIRELLSFCLKNYSQYFSSTKEKSALLSILLSLCLNQIKHNFLFYQVAQLYRDNCHRLIHPNDYPIKQITNFNEDVKNYKSIIERDIPDKNKAKQIINFINEYLELVELYEKIIKNPKLWEK